MSTTMDVGNWWLEANTYSPGKVWVEIADETGTRYAELSVEEAIQFSRMIIKAAAEAEIMLAMETATGATKTPA